MRNRDVFLTDPLENRLVNQGVAEVVDPGTEQERRTLRHELETFVCEGQYAKGLERILSAYLTNLDREEQPAVWVKSEEASEAPPGHPPGNTAALLDAACSRALHRLVSCL